MGMNFEESTRLSICMCGTMIVYLTTPAWLLKFWMRFLVQTTFLIGRGVGVEIGMISLERTTRLELELS
jgi:hypothetical protein